MLNDFDLGQRGVVARLRSVVRIGGLGLKDWRPLAPLHSQILVEPKRTPMPHEIAHANRGILRTSRTGDRGLRRVGWAGEYLAHETNRVGTLSTGPASASRWSSVYTIAP